MEKDTEINMEEEITTPNVEEITEINMEEEITTPNVEEITAKSTQETKVITKIEPDVVKDRFLLSLEQCLLYMISLKKEEKDQELNLTSLIPKRRFFFYIDKSSVDGEINNICKTLNVDLDYLCSNQFRIRESNPILRDPLFLKLVFLLVLESRVSKLSLYSKLKRVLSREWMLGKLFFFTFVFFFSNIYYIPYLSISACNYSAIDQLYYQYLIDKSKV